MLQDTPLTLLGYRMRDDWPNAYFRKENHEFTVLELTELIGGD